MNKKIILGLEKYLTMAIPHLLKNEDETKVTRDETYYILKP